MFPRLRDVMVLTILWWPYVVLTYHSATISRSLYMKQMDKKERAEVRLQKHIARENSMGRSNAAVVSAATKRGTIENEIEMLQTEESDEIYTKTWVDPAGVESDQPLSATKQEYISIVSYNVLGPLHGESSKHSYADTKGIHLYFACEICYILLSYAYISIHLSLHCCIRSILDARNLQNLILYHESCNVE